MKIIDKQGREWRFEFVLSGGTKSPANFAPSEETVREFGRTVICGIDMGDPLCRECCHPCAHQARVILTAFGGGNEKT